MIVGCSLSPRESLCSHCIRDTPNQYSLIPLTSPTSVLYMSNTSCASYHLMLYATPTPCAPHCHTIRNIQGNHYHSTPLAPLSGLLSHPPGTHILPTQHNTPSISHPHILPLVIQECTLSPPSYSTDSPPNTALCLLSSHNSV